MAAEEQPTPSVEEVEDSMETFGVDEVDEPPPAYDVAAGPRKYKDLDSKNEYTFQEMINMIGNNSGLNGCVIAVIHADGTNEVFGFGRASHANGAPPNGDTIFQIGSVSKTITGTLLADCILRQQTSLTDTVDAIVPQHVSPKFQQDPTPIALFNLTTHTSGLPRLPPNMVNRSPKSNPAIAYEHDPHTYRFLGNYKLTRAVGSKHEYSNIGAGLLAHCLELRSGIPYEQAVLQRILQPLGMESTRIVLPPPLAQRCAQGHNAEGHRCPEFKFCPALAGAGQWWSTGNDLVKYLYFQLGYETAAPIWPASCPPGTLDEKGNDANLTHLRRAVDLSQRELFRISEKQGIAMNWFIDYNQDLIWHNGSTATFCSQVSFNRKLGIGAVILVNQAKPPMAGMISRKVIRLLKGLPIHLADLPGLGGKGPGAAKGH